VFLPEGGALFADARSVWRWDPATNSVRELFAHHGRLVVFSADGSLCAADQYGYPDTDRGIQVYETKTGKLLTNLAARQNRFLAFSPDGKRLATVTYNTPGTSLVWLWDIAGGRPSQTWVGSDPLAFLPDSPTVARSGQEHNQVVLSATGAIDKNFLHGHHVVQALAFSPDGRILATAGADGPAITRGGMVVKPALHTIKLWDVATLTEIASFGDNEVPIDILAFSPDGKILVSAGSEERLDPSDREWIKQNSIDTDPVVAEEQLAQHAVFVYLLFLGGSLTLLLALLVGWILARGLGRRRALPPDWEVPPG
jgi:WD40 repeat protein